MPGRVQALVERRRQGAHELEGELRPVVDFRAQRIDGPGPRLRALDLIGGIRRDLGCGVLLISHHLQMVMDSDSDVVVLVPHEHDDPQSAAAPAAPEGRRADSAAG